MVRDLLDHGEPGGDVGLGTAESAGTQRRNTPARGELVDQVGRERAVVLDLGAAGGATSDRDHRDVRLGHRRTVDGQPGPRWSRIRGRSTPCGWHRPPLL